MTAHVGSFFSPSLGLQHDTYCVKNMDAVLPLLSEPLTVNEAWRRTAILDLMLVRQNILPYCRKCGHSYFYFISYLTHLLLSP